MSKINKKDERRIFAFLAVFLTIIGFIIAIISKRDDKYVMFYAKQGLVLFIIQLIASGLSGISIVGWFTSPAVWIIFFITWIIAWLNALSGKMKNTFLIGDLAEKIRL